MGSNEDMVGSFTSIPKLVLCGNELNCRSNERASVDDRRETIDGAEVARNINSIVESDVWGREEQEKGKCWYLVFEPKNKGWVNGKRKWEREIEMFEKSHGNGSECNSARVSVTMLLVVPTICRLK
ncbi:hypothetical protein Lal_00010004 [Lupinus albus]|nr:hypothetical protein Lal_00010004 [Lupinus albus]